MQQDICLQTRNLNKIKRSWWGKWTMLSGKKYFRIEKGRLFQPILSNCLKLKLLSLMLSLWTLKRPQVCCGNAIFCGPTPAFGDQDHLITWMIAKITKDYLLILIHSLYHDQDSTGHEYCWSILDGYRNENKSQVRDVPLCQICSFFLTFWHKIGIEFT